MNIAGLVVVGVIYIGVAADYVMKKDFGMALSFLCYAGANVGFIWSSLK